MNPVHRTSQQDPVRQSRDDSVEIWRRMVIGSIDALVEATTWALTHAGQQITTEQRDNWGGSLMVADLLKIRYNHETPAPVSLTPITHIPIAAETEATQ